MKQDDILLKLNRYLHSLLVIGLISSTVFLIFGSVMAIINHASLGQNLTPLNELLGGLMRMDGASYITLGILVLIATPILRVFGSLVFFLYQKDWKYIIATMLVLGIILAVIMVGGG
ncbi:MAG: DUF1634 domain-containing protein [Anaerolineae bacterium]|nr:DUF1634 domain-containing protein [Anaerolineae bacterium]